MSLTKVNTRMIDGAVLSLVDFGADPTGSSDSSTAIKNALESGAEFISVPAGTYSIQSNVSATLANTVTLYGNASFIYQGSGSNTSPMITIETGNNTLTIDGLSFDGNDEICAGFRIKNTASPSSNTLPNATVSNCLFIRFRMKVAALYNEAVYLEGSYATVTINNNRVRLITRAAGTGTSGSTGTAGISVVTVSATQYVRSCLHYGNEYTAIYGDDLVGSANNVDHDGFRFFSPSPAADSGQYARASLTSFGNTFRNCRGRAIKVQGTGSCSDETIIRDNDYTNYGGSIEINFQYGVGMVSNCRFFYRQYSSVSPIQTGLTLVSFYQGSDYGEDTGSCIVDGIQVYNSIGAGVGVDISSVVGATAGAGVATPLRPLVSVNNVSVNNNPIDFIATIGYEGTTYGKISLNNIVVPKLNQSAIGTNGTNTNFDISATNVVNIDGVTTPANSVNFVKTTAGATISYAGMMLGGLNQGFNSSYDVSSAVDNAPMLAGSALSDGTGNAGGAVSVQSISLADDASHIFASRFYNSSRGVFAVSVDYDYTSQGLFATGSNQIHSIAAHGSSVFEVSTSGANPDVDNKFNMWFTGGKLNVKNRLGASYVATVTFMG
tara:strand:+ start:368 stop:2191 length:1824 start_codon:yes stop_codon:yes gene_type:complete